MFVGPERCATVESELGTEGELHENVFGLTQTQSQILLECKMNQISALVLSAVYSQHRQWVHLE